MPDLVADESLLPDKVTDPVDTGDETLKRFRYQLTYASILSVNLQEKENDTIELFCELHEDILLKHSDNTFTGCQVKTKDLDLDPFTIDDEAIIKSCKRFTTLDVKFSGQFRSFHIISNAGFGTSKPAKCIKTLLANIKTDPTGESLGKKSKGVLFIKAIATECGCTTQQVINTLLKVDLRTYSSLDDIHMKLMNHLKSCPLLTGATESKLEELADLTIMKHFKASSLHFDESISFAYILGQKPIEDSANATIDGKKITKEDFKQWLSNQKTLPVTLLLKDRLSLSDLPKGHRNLEIKMDAGGIDSSSIDLMRDFKYSFENHAVSWLYKDDASSANAKYTQVTAIAQNICQQIYDEETIGAKTYGLPMLVKVRNKIEERQRENRDAFFDCTYEHLLGLVAVLTENCKVWWSEKFTITHD